jgi:hypothetical protein
MADMDHRRAPVLEALADYQRKDRYGFSPPGHRRGRGADDSVREVLGDDLFGADVLARLLIGFAGQACPPAPSVRCMSGFIATSWAFQ